ncbi:molybdopterin dinucleotide binding domain-containing protein [Methanoplanus endosymbiosus]|uniref:Molybdopterin dinucleotide-binding protein n=1 Tax=Methanoplanus endosymbiosus TaxID=33865 RepID=A0A9E7PMF0_9EURY|nr:molybdopterin dinucleotide binding domain-containing protein [Methanoplanus endosymbiosus]UUX91571.1 molybdopterin dinucleotide-binding protein [Methanoplanus endosymbiosus]
MIFHMITGRTVKQGVGVERKLSADYKKETSACRMNPLDMMDLGLNEGNHIKIISNYGEVVMAAVEDNTLTAGMIFIAYGPYCNVITSHETHGTGMPDFKSTPVRIEETDEDLKTVEELFRDMGGVTL